MCLYIFFILIALFFVFNKKISFKNSLIEIFISGFFTRLNFIFNTTIYDYANDVYEHKEYIKYILENNWKIPTISMIEINPIVYHPPLFHYLCAVFIKCNLFFENNLENCFKNLQYLLLVINLVTLFFMYKIIIELDITNKFAFFLLTFVPPMIWLSSFLNNDTLLFMFIFIIIFYTLKWFKNKNIKYMVIIAICSSLAMMTKFSILILVLCLGLIAALLLKDGTLDLLKQFLCFIIIFTTGFWFNIINIVKGYSPFLMVMPLETENFRKLDLYKLFLIDKYQIVNPFATTNINPTTNKNNINYFLYVIKSFLFAEKTHEKYRFLFLLILLAFIIIFIVSIIHLFKFKNKDISILFLKMYIIISFIIHLIYILGSPFVCTINARYIMPQLFILLILLFKQNKSEINT